MKLINAFAIAVAASAVVSAPALANVGDTATFDFNLPSTYFPQLAGGDLAQT